MTSVRILLPAALLATAFSAAPAAAEENLDCVAGGFSDTQQEVIRAFREAYDFDSVRNPSATPELAAVIRERVRQCAVEHGWSEEATAAAAQYAGPALFADVILQAMPIEPLQKFELLTNYEEADRVALIEAFSAVAGTSAFGVTPREATDADRAMVDSVVRVDGVPLEFEFGAWLGTWLTTSLNRDLAASRFEAL
ncbi:hypothetical protein [Aurantiacibacter gilvus]|uniref:DUF2059 domain-containing protein n=1 Tax=Aurantiacibacter gilvus TaxID=3139141 RepID=A0ABU9IDL8_9SPHN